MHVYYKYNQSDYHISISLQSITQNMGTYHGVYYTHFLSYVCISMFILIAVPRDFVPRHNEAYGHLKFRNLAFSRHNTALSMGAT